LSERANLRTGERRNVTVVFSDMEDFTALSERLDPEQMDALMDEIFGTFESIVRRHGGTVEKYIGDALVAVFGVPRLHEDDPLRAVNAALSFSDALDSLNTDYADRGISLRFRTGIHTGLITTGKRGEHDVVTGHAMSVASRLQEAAPPGRVLVSDDTRSQCEADFVFGPPQELHLKGKRGRIRAFMVQHRNPNPLLDIGPFVDRREELDRLVKAYLKHDLDAVGGFRIIGPPGIGKTRLAARFLDRIREFPGFNATILTARAHWYRALPFGVVIDLILSALGMDAEMPTERIREEIVKQLDLDEQIARDFTLLLTGGQSLENQAFVVLYVVLKTLVARHAESPYAPVVVIDIFVDCDASSRSFFEFYLKNAPAKPFFVLTYREDAEFKDTLFAELQSLQLEPLDEEASRELIGEFWPDDRDERTVREILANADGVPLFIQEYARFARDHRDLDTLPTTIQSIFLTSIENYSPELKDLLGKLAVFRQSFTAEDAEYVQQRTQSDARLVQSALSFFVRDGLIVESAGNYHFRHDVFKRALYDSLLNYNKAVLHRIIADRMRQQKRPHTLRLLYHLVKAGEYEQAHQTLIEATNRTVDLEFLEYYDTLLDNLEPEENRKRLTYQFLKSGLLFNNGYLADSELVLTELIKDGVRLRSVEHAAAATHLMTAHNVQSYGFRKAVLCGRKAAAYYDQLTTDKAKHGSADAEDTLRWRLSRLNTLKLMSIAHALSDDEEASRRDLEAMEPVDGRGKPQIATAWAEFHTLFGRYREGLRALEAHAPESLDEMERQAHDYMRTAIYWHLCDFPRLLETAGRLTVEQTDTSRDTVSQYRYRFSEVDAMRAVSEWYAGNRERAEKHLQHAEFTSLQVKNDFDLIDSLRTLAKATAIIGNPENARRHALQAVTLGLRRSAYYPTFACLVLLAEISFAADEHAAGHYFLGDAAFYLDVGVRLSVQDRIIYHYLAARRGPKPDAEGHREVCADLLRRELTEMRDQEQREALLSLRSFGRAYRELVTP